MPKRNKILDSQFKALIDELLKSGQPTRQISKELETKGFIISHSALANYHKVHLKNFKYPFDHPSRVKSKGSETRDVNVDIRNFINELTSERNIDYGDLALFSLRGLHKVYLNQLAIVHEKQERHAKGLGSFPKTEITALSTLQRMIMNFERGTYIHNQTGNLYLDEFGKLSPLEDTEE